MLSRLRRRTIPRRFGVDQRGVAAMEFALVALPFLTMVLFMFTIGINLFWREQLDNALHVAVRQLQTGQAQNLADGNAFIANYLCQSAGGLTGCANPSQDNIFIRVQAITFAPGEDFYNYTASQPPTTGGTLDLTNFASANFCNSGPTKFVLVTAVYLIPDIMGAMLPGTLSVRYNGGTVSAIMSETATVTENFAVQAASGLAAPPC